MPSSTQKSFRIEEREYLDQFSPLKYEELVSMSNFNYQSTEFLPLFICRRIIKYLKRKRAKHVNTKSRTVHEAEIHF